MTTVACSAASTALLEPLAGTAPTALTWIVVEHPGPWGRDALADAALPDDVRRALMALKSAGNGVLLGRPIDRRAASSDPRIMLARTAPGGTLLRQGSSPGLTDLRTWDPDALAAGQLPPFGRASSTPVLLVCTQGRRDACCAVHGRELVRGLEAAASADERASVWETSHIGGHRFAAVTLTLPSGEIHGRLGAQDASRLLTATLDGRVIPELLRGRCSQPPPLQRACIEIRRLHGVAQADALDALLMVGERAVPAEPPWQPDANVLVIQVRHSDGRAWEVTVERSPVEPRPESCGLDPVPGTAWSVVSTVPVPDWR